MELTVGAGNMSQWQFPAKTLYVCWLHAIPPLGLVFFVRRPRKEVKAELQEALLCPNFWMMSCAVHWLYPVLIQPQAILRQEGLQG